MAQVKVKICGITNLKDALASIKAGADALGFVFYKKSPRYISPMKARGIIGKLPAGIIKIGVFCDEKEAAIKNISGSCKLDMLQFHGDETPKFCARFKGRKIIKAFRVKERLERADIIKYKTCAYLFDAFVKSRPGGTGRRFNWVLIKEVKSFKQPVFLSGGLNHVNVKKAVKSVGPAWVDVSTSVEIKPGRKDPVKVREFIKAAKG
jgi:phosphoribosylanthranilate isomerase